MNINLPRLQLDKLYHILQFLATEIFNRQKNNHLFDHISDITIIFYILFLIKST